MVIQRASSRTVGDGYPISVSPAVGSTGTRGDTVTLKVSTGPPLISLPSYIGKDADDARDALEHLGFVVNQVSVTITSGSSGKVITQTPTGGEVPEGSTVTLGVGVRAR